MAHHIAVMSIRLVHWYTRQSIHLIGLHSLCMGCVAAALHRFGYIPGGWYTVLAVFVLPIIGWIASVWQVQRQQLRR